MARCGISDVRPPCSCDDEKQDLTFSAPNSIAGYKRHSKTDRRAFLEGRHSSVKESDKAFGGLDSVERETALERK